MNGFVAPLLSFLLLYKYWALFLVMFVAAIILPLPTNSMLLATGAFASQGYFSFSLSFAIAVAASILGDCLDYFLARVYGHRMLKVFRLRVPLYLERLEHYAKRHSGLTIFFTRFAGTADSLANLLSGFIGISPGTFVAYDFLGNAVSIGVVLYSGYFLGSHWQNFSELFSIARWILLGFIVIVALAVVLWYRNHAKSEV